MKLHFRLTLALLPFFTSPAYAGPFTCDGKLFQVATLSTTGPTQQLLQLDLSTNSYIPIAAVDGVRLNSTGYREQDGFVYGLLQSTGDVVRLHSDGSTDILGGGSAIAFTRGGDVSPDGYLYSYNESTDNIEVIDVTTTPPSIIDLVPVTNPAIIAGAIVDLAFDGNGRLHVSVTSDGYYIGDLTGVNNPAVTTAITFTRITDAIEINGPAAQWVDGDGVYFASYNSSGNLYRYNRGAGTFELVLTPSDTPGSPNDGFSCRRFTPLGIPNPVPTSPLWILLAMISAVTGCAAFVQRPRAKRR